MLEGLPLSVLISIIIIAIGAVLLLSLYSYAKVTNLGSITAATSSGAATGFLSAAPTRLTVTAWAQAGSTLGGVSVLLNGTGISERSITSANGSVVFWITPVLHDHATSGVLTILGTYSPTVSLVAPPSQSYTLTLTVLS